MSGTGWALRLARTVVLVGLTFGLASGRADAQGLDDAWGVIFAVSPSWTSLDQSKHVLGANALTVEGSDLSVGFARGRLLSGDWGVSYVRKTIKRDSVIDRDSGVYTFGDSSRLDGVEIRKAAVFGNIKDRVQLGLEFGFGAGWAKGVTSLDRLDFSTCCLPVMVTEPSTAKQALALYDEVEIMPLYRVEFAAGVILARGFKLRFTSGFDTFGKQPFRVGLVYLFGVD